MIAKYPHLEKPRISLEHCLAYTYLEKCIFKVYGTCAVGGLNPGRNLGKVPYYHYTNGAINFNQIMAFYFFLCFLLSSRNMSVEKTAIAIINPSISRHELQNLFRINACTETRYIANIPPRKEPV